MGYHSIRINDPWRIVFTWNEHGPAEVRIGDYHCRTHITRYVILKEKRAEHGKEIVSAMGSQLAFEFGYGPSREKWEAWNQERHVN